MQGTVVAGSWSVASGCTNTVAAEGCEGVWQRRCSAEEGGRGYNRVDRQAGRQAGNVGRLLTN